MAEQRIAVVGHASPQLLAALAERVRQERVLVTPENVQEVAEALVQSSIREQQGQHKYPKVTDYADGYGICRCGRPYQYCSDHDELYCKQCDMECKVCMETRQVVHVMNFRESLLVLAAEKKA